VTFPVESDGLFIFQDLKQGLRLLSVGAGIGAKLPSVRQIPVPGAKDRAML
jgi:hypothetical protein